MGAIDTEATALGAVQDRGEEGRLLREHAGLSMG